MTLQSTGRNQDASDDIGRRIVALAPWFQNIHLPSGHQTAPDHPLGDYPAFKWEQLRDSLPVDMSGWTALDIGCNAGFYSFELARRGASVVGIDHDEHYLSQARWIAGQLDLEGHIAFRRLGVYDLARIQEIYDLVLFMGVLYHLRYPLLALDLVSEKVRKVLVLQTLTMPEEEILPTPDDLSIERRELMLAPGWPKMAFIEHSLAGDATNWWAPNAACVEAMVRTCAMRVVDRPGHEIYVCERDARTGAGRDELDAATGRNESRVVG